MTTTRNYQSTDSGAPALTGQVGSGIAWFKACLVGIGGVAYGTGINEKQAAGWTVAYEDAPNNICVFQNSTAHGGGFYVRVDDNGTGTGGAREMLIRAYRTMSDVNTGTDPTPTVAQVSSGLVLRKSIALNSTSREWIMAADELTFSISVHPGNVASSRKDGHYAFHAGNYDCDDPSQPCPFVIGGAATQSATNAGSQNIGIMALRGSSSNGLYVMRGVSHAVGAEAVVLNSLTSTGPSPVGGSNMPMANPMPGSGLTVFHPAFLCSSTTLFGKLRGLYMPIQNISDDEMGALYPSPAGLDPASVLMGILHQATPAGVTGRGHLAVETALEW